MILLIHKIKILLKLLARNIKIILIHSLHQQILESIIIQIIRMSCDTALLSYYDSPEVSNFDYYHYSSMMTPEQ
jgi:hypothetical protein